jgi:nucleotide-binding universal stress UspA family protein
LKSEELVDVSPLFSEGEAAEKIIDSAKATANSLIAMCTHGRSGIQRWALGSVTEKVVRHSESPVLVIPAREKSALHEPIDEMRDFLKYSLD